MRRRLAHLIVSLYPLGFRRRYGEEMAALLDEAPVRNRALLDLLRGALAAYVRAPSTAAAAPADRMRASASGVLACWVVFAAAGFGFYKTTEDAPFRAAARIHPLLGYSHLVVQALAVAGSVAVVLGALPLMATAAAHARHHRRLALLLCAPVAAVALFTALTALLADLAHSGSAPRAGTVGGVAFIAWGIAGLLCGAICVTSARAALFAVPVPPRRLLGAMAGGAVASSAMVAMALAAALYAVALGSQAPALAGAPNGPLHLVSAGASVIAQLIVMAIAAALASVATRRGLRGARA